MASRKLSVAAVAATPVRDDRSRTPASRPSPSKVPLASQLIEQGPRPRTAARSLPASAPVTICVYKITDQAGDVWGAQEGKDVALWQIQFVHPAKPSVSFDVVNSFNDYLRVMRRDDEALPANLVELQSQAMVR